ncbi:MAG: SCO family protein [Limisphaerales bacterium]
MNRLFVLVVVLLNLHLPASAQMLTDKQLSQVNFDQKLGAQLPLNLWFRDEAGKDVKLGEYFGNKPVILVLGYYQCPMLCNATFNGMIEALNDMRWSIGREFQVVHVSIDPTETSELARKKKQTYLKRYGRAGASDGWHFLTGEQRSIQLLVEQAGFRYAYDPEVKQYAHPGGLIVVTPQGKITKYLAGVTYSPEQVFNSLRDASQERIGQRVKDLFLLCFSHNPSRGKYGTTIMIAARTLGVSTCLGLTCLIVALVRREQKKAIGPSSDAKPKEPAS